MARYMIWEIIDILIMKQFDYSCDDLGTELTLYQL